MSVCDKRSNNNRRSCVWEFVLSAVSQFTEEKLGQAEKTELDAHFENLMSRADCTKNWTEKIYRQTEVLLQPNPSMTYIQLSYHYSWKVHVIFFSLFFFPYYKTDGCCEGDDQFSYNILMD